MRHEHWILDDNKELVPVDFMTWAVWFEFIDNRIVKRTDCSADTCYVSTVFIGIDHRITGGRPLLFETMVFGGAAAGHCERWSTYKEASLFHDVVVGQVEEIPIWKHALANVRDDIVGWWESLRLEIKTWYRNEPMLRETLRLRSFRRN